MIPNATNATDEAQYEKGDTIYANEIDITEDGDWTKHQSAPKSWDSPVSYALLESPDGTYIRVSYRTDQRTLTDDGETVKFNVRDVGTDINCTLETANGDIEGEDLLANFIIGDWGVYDIKWRGKTVSVSTEMGGFEWYVDDSDYPEIETLWDLRDAGQHEITFKVELTE